MQEKDLVELLSFEERTELLALVEQIMKTMKKRLQSGFESRTRDSQIARMIQENPNVGPSDIDASPPEATQTNKEQEDQDKERQKQEALETERQMSKKMQELKPLALENFDQWRAALFHRILEAIQKDDSRTSNTVTVQRHGTQPLKDTQQTSSDGLQHWYPRIDTPLSTEISKETAPLVLHAFLLLSISLETYDPRSRTLLLYLCNSLNIPISILLQQESATAHVLVASVQSSSANEKGGSSSDQMTADAQVQKRIDDGRNTRRWKIGLASVAGAVLIGVTGGLAAPLVAAGLGTLLGGIGLGGTVAAGYLGAMAASAPLVGGLFGAYGGRMTGNMMERYTSDVQDFAFLPLKPKLESKLRVIVCISGWLTDEDQVMSPWRGFNDCSNAYALRWEMQALLDLGDAIETMVKNYAIKYIKAEIIKRTVLASLWSALWPLGLLKIAQVVDNPFSIAKARADKAGLVLADAIAQRAQGKRPISLVGYSLGARVIYACLLSLAERKVFGMIENVVLMGAPTPSNAESWGLIRGVVSGRVVNAYAEDDWVLGFLYRTSAIQLGVAGLQKIEGVEGVENVDVSDIVDGHLKYAERATEIVGRVLDADVKEIQMVH